MDAEQWSAEGFVLDDACNLIGMSYVDLRDGTGRTPIRNLIKACKREHALEDSETILISPVARFRNEGKNLIRDPQEGRASVESRTVKPLTAEQEFQESRLSDLSEASELLDSGFSLRTSASHENVERSSDSLAYGGEWWIYSTAIAPETEEEWAALRATLDPAYDHESVIGQPAKFAEALGRMVAEQLGAQGKDGWFRSGLEGVEGDKTFRPTQWVLHGPMVYSDRLYETLAGESDEAARIAAMLFTKSHSHAAMREYRFAILRDGTVDDKVLLTISGMMRDALRPTGHGLVRPVPAAGGEKDGSGGGTSGSAATKVWDRRESTTRQIVRRAETRSQVTRSDGQVVTSDSESSESVEETSECTVANPAAEGPGKAAKSAGVDGETLATSEGTADGGAAGSVGRQRADEEVAKEIAFGERGNADGTVADGMQPAEVGGTDVLESLEQSLARMIDDPAAPLGPVSESWAESALSAEDVRTIHGLGAALTLKVTQLGIENRRDASSACWHAMQCIRNVVARVGRIVTAVSIGRERFVVIELGGSGDGGPSGRIVVAPSGGYVYWLKGRNVERWGYGKSEFGTVWFPMDGDVAKFEEAGWRAEG